MVLFSGSWHSGRIYAQLVYTQLNVFCFFYLLIFWCNSERKSLSGVSLLLLKMFHIVVTMTPQTVADTSMVRFHLFIVF